MLIVLVSVFKVYRNLTLYISMIKTPKKSRLRLNILLNNYVIDLRGISDDLNSI